MNNPNVRNITIDVWGDFACFTRPEQSVERDSYPCMTPSAARGILCAIYMKPSEFYYEVTSIEIMKPIKYVNLLRNEIKKKIDEKLNIIFTDSCRTQRNTSCLKDVYYRIHARIIKRNDCTNRTIDGILAQFTRRVEKGQCFRQPSFGIREFACHFTPANKDIYVDKSINLDVGNMLYDVFDINKNIPLVTGEDKRDDSRNISFFHAIIKDGILRIPDFESDRIRRIKDVERGI